MATLSHNGFFASTSTLQSLDIDFILRVYPLSLMGENLSWEVVGIMLTVLGLSAMALDEVIALDDIDLHNNWTELAQKLVGAGDQ